jgi:hypothetical protein
MVASFASSRSRRNHGGRDSFGETSKQSTRIAIKKSPITLSGDDECECARLSPFGCKGAARNSHEANSETGKARLKMFAATVIASLAT